MGWGSHCPDCGKTDCKWVHGPVCQGTLPDFIKKFAALKAENERLTKERNALTRSNARMQTEHALAERAGGGGKQDAIDFLYKHGALTHVAAREAVELLTSNGFEISRRSK